jgi:hypothetical protein
MNRMVYVSGIQVGLGRISTRPPVFPLTPTLSPSAGARGKPTYCRRSSLSPAEGERVGVRGPAVVLTRCARRILRCAFRELLLSDQRVLEPD